MPATTQNDFDKLCESIKDALSGLPPFAPNATRSRFRSSFGLTVTGVIFTVLGALGAFSFGFFATVAAFLIPYEELVGIGTILVLFLVLTGLSIWALIYGMQRIRLSRNLNAFKRIFDNREVCTFTELSARTQMPPQKVIDAARKLIQKGLLPQGRIDDETTCLMVTDNAYRLYQQAKSAQAQRELEQKAQEEHQRAARAATAELDPEASAFIAEGTQYIEQLRKLDGEIDDPALSERIVTIENLLEHILARVKEEPAQMDKLRRLKTYYLPTTIKLLNSYEELEEQPIEGKNIAASRQEIEQTLDMLCAAYEKLLDSTFQDLTMDISSDAAVLQTMLSQEGLTKNPFSKSGDA